MTLTRTSPALGGATVMVSSTSGCLAARATMALQVIGFPAVSLMIDWWSEWVNECYKWIDRCVLRVRLRTNNKVGGSRAEKKGRVVIDSVLLRTILFIFSHNKHICVPSKASLYFYFQFFSLIMPKLILLSASVIICWVSECTEKWISK